jgi:hypothetical protein
VAPILSGLVARRLCVELQRRGGPERTERAAVLRRDRAGGYHTEAHGDDEGESRRQADRDAAEAP